MSKITFSPYTTPNSLGLFDKPHFTPSDSSLNTSGSGFKDIITSTVTLETELQTIRGQLKGSAALSPRELLYYQVRVGEYGLRVELLSKTAESALATLRKLQNTQ